MSHEQARPTQPISAAGDGGGYRSALNRHQEVRVEQVIKNMSGNFAGRPLAEVAAEMATQLRALGVNLPMREVERLAGLIATHPGGS
ncbi:hypothetical protein [Pilimelia anulata]|nr:hypothetical protein [Pilimelia anulata]